MRLLLWYCPAAADEGRRGKERKLRNGVGLRMTWEEARSLPLAPFDGGLCTSGGLGDLMGSYQTMDLHGPRERGICNDFSDFTAGTPLGPRIQTL